MSDRVTSVRTRLGDPEPEVRRLATQEIPALPAPESCELLLVALSDADLSSLYRIGDGQHRRRYADWHG